MNHLDWHFGDKRLKLVFTSDSRWGRAVRGKYRITKQEKPWWDTAGTAVKHGWIPMEQSEVCSASDAPVMFTIARTYLHDKAIPAIGFLTKGGDVTNDRLMGFNSGQHWDLEVEIEEKRWFRWKPIVENRMRLYQAGLDPKSTHAAKEGLALMVLP